MLVLPFGQSFGLPQPLEEEGGPNYSAKVRSRRLPPNTPSPIPRAPDGERPGIPADRWPAPFATEQDARDANNGALPPDFSVLAKARTVHRPGLGWVMNYFIAYQKAVRTMSTTF